MRYLKSKKRSRGRRIAKKMNRMARRTVKGALAQRIGRRL